MLEDEYTLDYFTNNGLTRKICKSCGSAFWTRDPEREFCGDAPCEPYSFIGNPVFNPHSIDEMREAYLSFFEQHNHTRLERYPVAARWRDDIYLTIASIADFQPFVTSGEVPPPANPLTISQPCIRLNDLDSVGRSGRHLTTFEMMAHHAFNSPKEEIYWKDQTVGLCDEFLSSIGADLNAVTYKEHPWIGGGNAGPSVEVMIGGLEVATLVFMSMTKKPNGRVPVDLEGVAYYPMDMRIVDTGYGLERFVWASQGSPTIYDAVFPEMVSRLMSSADLECLLDEKECTRILAMNAKYAGLMDITGSNLFEMRRKVAESIGVPFRKLQDMIAPIERVYAIADHTRCLAYMLGDCIVPSNAQEGYLARLVLRRTLRMMNELEMEDSLADLIQMQMEKIGTGSFGQAIPIVREIIENEVVKYDQTMLRGRRIVQKLAREYKSKGEPVPLKELITLYDSHGIPPEMVRDAAADDGATVDLPDNFYSLIADVHSESEGAAEVKDELADLRTRIEGMAPTTTLYYDLPDSADFDAIVLDQFDEYLILDRTLFYPEGGGQPSDIGRIVSEEGITHVEHVMKIGDVIVHKVKGEALKRGDIVKGVINEERRKTLMRHHTATHVLLHAARVVLGAHIHQAGAQKGEESSRIDIRHYKHITAGQLREIENAANRMVLADLPVHVGWEDRTTAEQKYGFDLYQGGVPPGSRIRVVQVSGDVQACAGTHCPSTGQIGSIRIIRVDHVQDGIERLEFAAGMAAVAYNQNMEGLVDGSAAILSVQRENLPTSVERFFNEWKDQRKEIERLQKKIADLETKMITSESIGGVDVTVHALDASPKEMVTIATGIANDGGVALIAGGTDRVHVVAASGTGAVNASDIVREVCQILGGKGGGKPGLAQGSGASRDALDDALARGKQIITEQLS
ncbi:alanine--tRNA ligase [Methanomicrobiaceae archaeon CYW5]|uniref:alanine--tRNA ligase n=1 Tax=Methanovulcanius yangii TaxID=1789227 RepID=UPI0029CAA77B|nr:alanine--tRNA ligase [Methanovulcanius yangii]MBT8507759.1 alanine--tRNA ligase [Methanovulcanius yangii]